MNTGQSLTTETHRTPTEATQPTHLPTLTVNSFVCLVRRCMFGCFLNMKLSFPFATLKQPQHIIQSFPRDPPSRASLVSEIDEDRWDGTWKFQCFDSLCCTRVKHWGVCMSASLKHLSNTEGLGLLQLCRILRTSLSWSEYQPCWRLQIYTFPISLLTSRMSDLQHWFFNPILITGVKNST